MKLTTKTRPGFAPIPALHVAVLTALLYAVAPGAAEATLLLEPTSDTGTGVFYTGGVTLGYQFTITTTENVAALGLWDHSSDGLNGPHEVGLWNNSGTLLASTTVSNASVVVPSTFNEGRWMFEDITAISIGPGTYYLGMQQPSSAQDLYVAGTVAVNVAGASKGNGSVGGLNSNALVFPNIFQASDAYFGPNFSTTSVAAPEPTSALLLLGSGAVLLLRRRRAAAL